MKSKITLSLAGIIAVTLLCIVACTELTPVVDEMLYTAAVDAYEKQNSSKKDNTDTDNSTNSDSSDSNSSDSNSNSGSTDSNSSDSNSSDSNSNSNSGSADSDSSDSNSSDSNGNSNSGSTDSNSSGSGSSSSGSNVTTDSDTDDAGYDSSITFTSDAEDYDGEISTATGTEEGYEYVDLGLTSGLKWARMNIGAESPEERGSYYAWGELVTKDEYSDDNCANCGLEIDDIIGNPNYDAAAALWGGHWRMPDTDEFQELIDECEWDWVKYNDVTGYVITGPNGSSIFMPTTGYIYLSTLYYESSKGLYWSAIADTADTDMAYHLYFYSTKHDYNSFWNYRRNGRTIRAIYDEEFEYEEETTNVYSDATGTDDNGYEYVDLGLSSGLKWARVNIGASSPEDYGNYYAWGETETKSTYTSSNSVTYGDSVIFDIAGDPEYDAAQANWGGHWRMPTLDECDELRKNCEFEIAISNGDTIGYIVTGPNGNTILLPATGYKSNRTVNNKPVFNSYNDKTIALVNYWSSTCNSSSAYKEKFAGIMVGTAGAYHYTSRYLGLPVRAIYDEDFDFESKRFELNGICYEITSSSEVCVTYYSKSSNNSSYYTGSVSIPYSVLHGGTTYNVTSIGSHAFNYCTNLTSITISEGVINIDDNAFKYCTNLSTVKFSGNSVTSIGDYAFYGCSSLTDFDIPDGVTSIGDYSFYGCSSLTDISIPDGVAMLENYVFANCSSLNNINISDGVTQIYAGTFKNCSSLTSITIPDNVTYISTSAFQNCSSLTSINIPDGVTYLGSSVFQNCSSLTSVTIPDGVTSVYSSLFKNCTSLTSVNIPNKSTYIMGEAFYNCYSLTSSVVIPESVKSVGKNAFYNCSSLTSVTCLATSPPTVYETSFYNVSATLHVPSSALSDYQSADYWSDFDEILGDAD